MCAAAILLPFWSPTVSVIWTVELLVSTFSPVLCFNNHNTILVCPKMLTASIHPYFWALSPDDWSFFSPQCKDLLYPVKWRWTLHPHFHSSKYDDKISRTQVLLSCTTDVIWSQTLLSRDRMVQPWPHILTCLPTCEQGSAQSCQLFYRIK